MQELSPQPPQHTQPDGTAPPFRIDLQLHQILYKQPAAKPTSEPERELLTLPEPVYPQRAAGYKMVNPKQHMDDMLKLMRGEVPPWNCRAGQNSLNHPHRRNTCALLPHVFRNTRLGSCRRPQV